jgi:hypothetical protein
VETSWCSIVGGTLCLIRLCQSVSLSLSLPLPPRRSFRSRLRRLAGGRQASKKGGILKRLTLAACKVNRPLYERIRPGGRTFSNLVHRGAF